MVDRTYKDTFSEKKTYSVSAATLKPLHFDGTNSIDLFNIPEKSLITKASIVVEVAGNSGLQLTVNAGSLDFITSFVASTLHNFQSFEFTSGGLGASAGSSVVVGSDVYTGTGTVISVKPNIAVTSGEFTVIVEYVEYTLGVGMYTRISNN